MFQSRHEWWANKLTVTLPFPFMNWIKEGRRGARWLEALWENAQSYTESNYWCCEESFFRRKTWASRCVRRKEGGKTQVATLSEISTWLGSTGGTLGGANDCYRGRLILMCRCSRRYPPPNAASFSYLLTLKRKLRQTPAYQGCEIQYTLTHTWLTWAGLEWRKVLEQLIKTVETKVLFLSYLERLVVHANSSAEAPTSWSDKDKNTLIFYLCKSA